MKIIIGSKNKTKIKAVKSVFKKNRVTSIDAASDVSAQPVGDTETLQGAINRAKNIRQAHQDDFALGLEGGVSLIDDKLYLINWGALIDTNDKLYTASGARIELPLEFYQDIQKGQELSEIMDDYTQQNDVRNHEGAIGIFTNNLIDRASMFEHVVKLLKGQYEFHKNK